MDIRVGLNPSELSLLDRNGNIEKFNIINEMGRGGSCIAYSATYLSNQGLPISVNIKECYPFELDITRNESGKLIVSCDDIEKFEQYKAYAEEAFKNNTELYRSEMANGVVIPEDIYWANDTVYVVTRPLQGNILCLDENYSFFECIQIIKSVAKSIRNFHNKGLLYLDVKPSNIWIVKDHTDYVQFFDFNSVIPIDKNKRKGNSIYRISYTKGFAPLEQQRGDMKKVGIESDVYSVGALLFYLVFHKVPDVYDCEGDAKYAFADSILNGKNYSNRLYKLLSDFFHRTLASYYRDRYENIQLLEDALVNIEKYAKEKEIYVHKSHPIKPGYCFGREVELKTIYEWDKKTDESCLIVSGLGGLGKSTLVRQYIEESKEKYDNIIVLTFTESIIHTVCDDNQLRINIIERDKEESEEDYFIRKINALKNILEGENTLWVIDNVIGEITRDFSRLFDEWRVIITTRENRINTRHQVLLLEEIKENTDFYSIVEEIIGYELSDENRKAVDTVIERAYRNTLVVEMFAKQIKCSRMSFDKMLEIAENICLTQIDKEKIDVVYDDEVYHSTIGEFLSRLFSIENMSERKQCALKILSIYGTSRMAFEDLCILYPDVNLDDINELSAEGWIYDSENGIEMHPLIKECVSNSEWSDFTRKQFENSVKTIYFEISLEGEKEQYPRKIVKKIDKLKENEKAYEIVKNFYRKCIKKDDFWDELYLERIERGGWDEPVDRVKLNRYLGFAEQFLIYAKAHRQIIKSVDYENVEYIVIRNLPSDREEDILKYSMDILESENSITEIAFMNVIEKVIDILVARKEYDLVEEYLDKAYRFAKKKRSNYSWGRYYDLLSWYYDDKLDGNYNDSEDFQMMITAADKSIKYMKRARGNRANILYAKYLLDKVNILMRSGRIDKEEIDKKISIVKNIIQDNTLSIAKVRYQYNMVCARYYVDVIPSHEYTNHFIKSAIENAKESDISVMEMIDDIVVPAADMSYEHKMFELAEKNLIIAIKWCEIKIDMLPYARKKKELLSHLLDVYAAMGEVEKIEAIKKELAE